MRLFKTTYVAPYYNRARCRNILALGSWGPKLNNQTTFWYAVPNARDKRENLWLARKGPYNISYEKTFIYALKRHSSGHKHYS